MNHGVEDEDVNPRYKRAIYQGFRTKNTNFNFDLIRNPDSLGTFPIYNSFDFGLATYKDRTVVDLHLVLP